MFEITYLHTHYFHSKVWGQCDIFYFIFFVSSAHQECIYLIKSAVKTLIL